LFERTTIRTRSHGCETFVNPFSDLEKLCRQQFVSKRALVVNGIMFPVAQYPELKGFFDKVLAADQEQLVLQSTVATAGK
jgi:hypothetical protein